MDKVKLGSNYPEITGNAVFYNHECFSRFGIEVEQVNPPKQGLTLNEALISGAVDVTPCLATPPFWPWYRMPRWFISPSFGKWNRGSLRLGGLYFVNRQDKSR